MEIKLHSVINDAELFKCNEYDFTSKSEQGLKTHIKRKHKKLVILKRFQTNVNYVRNNLNIKKK